MDRQSMLQQLETVAQWDIVIIGGGATGLGAAVDAASRGYKTLLVEQADFAKGTSGKSTKLVHGGVRYLADNKVLVYSEYHIDELQPYVEPPTQPTPDFIMI